MVTITKALKLVINDVQVINCHRIDEVKNHVKVVIACSSSFISGPYKIDNSSPFYPHYFISDFILANSSGRVM